MSQQARAEQEEEFISNTLFKKIQALQKEKETLAVNYEKEEEFLTNELSRKLMQVSGGNRGVPCQLFVLKHNRDKLQLFLSCWKAYHIDLKMSLLSMFCSWLAVRHWW